MKLKTTRFFLQESTEMKEHDASNQGCTARANPTCQVAEFVVNHNFHKSEHQSEAEETPKM